MPKQTKEERAEMKEKLNQVYATLTKPLETQLMDHMKKYTPNQVKELLTDDGPKALADFIQEQVANAESTRDDTAKKLIDKGMSEAEAWPTAREVAMQDFWPQAEPGREG